MLPRRHQGSGSEFKKMSTPQLSRENNSDPSAVARPAYRGTCRHCVTRCVTARRANHQKPVQPFTQKYSAFVLTQIIGITPSVSRRMRGVGHRHERAVRCDGRESCDRRVRLERAAKSCGSGAAVLALSSRKRAFANDGGKKAVLREEHDISRKAIAQGRPECFRRTCMLVCAFAVCIGTRDRGCGKQPVFPAPSDKEGGKFQAKLGRNAPRDRCSIFSCHHPP